MGSGRRRRGLGLGLGLGGNECFGVRSSFGWRLGSCLAGGKEGW